MCMPPAGFWLSLVHCRLAESRALLAGHASLPRSICKHKRHLGIYARVDELELRGRWRWGGAARWSWLVAIGQSMAAGLACKQ